jgi:putative sterol carrier protein
MAVVYPSTEWAEEWRKVVNTSEPCKEAGKNWGVDFNGNFLFVIEPGSGLEKTTYLYFGYKAGECTDARVVDAPSEVNPGFTSTGPYENFKKVVKGEVDFIEMTMKGALVLKGDFGKIMRNAKFVRAVADSIKSIPVPVTYLGE